MADTTKTVEIIFGGVDKTGSTITSVGRNLDSLVNKAGDITGPMASVTDSIIKLDAALVAVGVAALAFATKEAVTFEAALIDLQKVLDESEGSASDYSDQFSDLSSRFGVSADAIIQSTADFRQAGFNISDSLTLVEQSLLAVNAADLTTQQSSELLIGTLAGFQAPASRAASLLDVLNGVSNKAGASVQQLGDGFRILAPVANTLGLSFEETAALLTPVVEVTRSGTESANALKTAISNLIKPTKERKELLEDELGIQLEIDGQRRDTKDVLYDLIAATQDLDNNEKQRVATVIAGAEQMSRFIAVLNGAERSEEILQIALNSSGSALEEFEVKTQSAEFALKQLRSAFTTAAATAGLEYIDQTKAVTQATSSLVDSFREAIQGDNADVLFEALRNGLDSFAQQVDTIAKNLPEAFEGLEFTDLLAAFDDLGSELGDLFGAVFGDVDLSTVEGLRDAMQQVVDAFTALTNVSAGIANGLEPLFIAIGTGIEKFQSLDEETKKSAGEILGLAKTINTVLPAIGGLAGGLESIGTGLTALAGAQGFKALIGNLGSIKAIATSTAGKGGLIGLALTGGVGLGSFINEIFEEELDGLGQRLFEYFNADELREIAQAFAPLAGEAKKLGEETEELRQISGRYDEMNQALGQTMGYTTEITEEQRAEFNRYAAQLVENSKKTEEFSGSQRGITDAVEELSRSIEASGGALGNVSKTTEELAKNNKSLQLGYDETSGKINSFSGTIVNSNKALEDAAKKTEEVVKQTEAYQIKLLELNSNEFIKQIEAKVSLDIAEVEAGADRVEAIAQTISDTFSNTGSVISDLFGGFDDASRSTQIEIASQIRKEQEFRQQALDDQSALTKAEIEFIREKTRQLARGDALIKVDGAGLQPHLEAFMFEILRELQVRVNADGEEMLLGLNL
ncbi:phage tail tape measure protein [Marinobacter salarius]|uniref:phage tail tape measure protein n=2 Tax=Marinobacter TaxID=2742 RepID=UPI00241FF01D|nr:phage tail tape measure protein [Marinobacter salarius]